MQLPIKIYICILSCCALFVFTECAFSVETAPRISDREIIESLAELKAGQAALNKRIDDQNSSIDKRFDEQNKTIALRFDVIDQRFKAVDQRFEAVNQRFDAVNQRFEDQIHSIDNLRNTNLAMFGAILSVVVAIFGYIIWDRRTMLKPLTDRMETMEKNLVQELDLTHEDGSKITRLVAALRELAKEDQKVAAVLRSFSLL